MGFKIFEKNRIVVGGVVCCCLIMVLLPEITAEASKETIALWLNSIVLVLLPFFIAANFLKSTGIVGKISPRIYLLPWGFLQDIPWEQGLPGIFTEKDASTKGSWRIIRTWSRSSDEKIIKALADKDSTQLALIDAVKAEL